jgi:hypothetical protein
MIPDLLHKIRVALDPEIKTPRVVHACLPNIAGLVVLPRVKRRVMEILEQELRLFVERFLDRFWRFGIVAKEMFREAEDHSLRVYFFFLRSFPASVCNEAMNASWVLNGP